MGRKYRNHHCQSVCCWDAKKYRVNYRVIPALLCITMLRQTNCNYVIQMMPLPLLSEMWKAIICHGG
jgi:hypothetical protein